MTNPDVADDSVRNIPWSNDNAFDPSWKRHPSASTLPLPSSLKPIETGHILPTPHQPPAPGASRVEATSLFALSGKNHRFARSVRNDIPWRSNIDTLPSKYDCPGDSIHAPFIQSNSSVPCSTHESSLSLSCMKSQLPPDTSCYPCPYVWYFALCRVLTVIGVLYYPI